MVIYGYMNNKKVVGIQPTNSAMHYYNYYTYNNSYANNRQGRRQRKREQAKYERTQQKFQLKKPQVAETQKAYSSTPNSNILYYMEYCKARNTRIYGQLNNISSTSTQAQVINYQQRSDTKQFNPNTNRIIEEYKRSQANGDIIDYKRRRKSIEKQRTKNIIKFDRKKQTTQSRSTSNQGGKSAMSKKEEMRSFKSEIKKQAERERTPMDKVVDDFEKALREKREYDKSLRNNGYRVIKGNRYTGRDR